ncbi:MAG: aldehyde dehydrogenase family protein [Deltaproteobacteria bacterium]
MVSRLREGAVALARLSLRERVGLARAMQASYLAQAEEIVRASCAAKGLRQGTPSEGEEWATGPWCVVRHLRLVTEALESLARTGNTPIGSVERTTGGRLAVRVFPASRIDGILFGGITVDVHLLDGVTEEAMHASRAPFYRGRAHDGRTVLVLGAGNLSGIPAMDVITKLFNEAKACLLKMNPVNAYLGPFMEAAFAEPIRQGFLAIAYGGSAEGAHLIDHPGIDEIHLTGSDATYDRIVWGPPGAERETRKARNEPLVTKPITAELGNVSPVILVPGPYSDRELAFQARSIAGAVTCNASFNCNSAKMLITPRGWARRDALLAAVEQAWASAPARVAYYPGAADRWRQLTRNRPRIRLIGGESDGRLPWTLLPGLDADDPAEAAFSTEPFCSVLSETPVASDDPVDFLERAVDFANERLWGTLSADIVVHPATLRDPRVASVFEQAISRLRYGAVTVNSWSGFVFTYGTPPWGAYPGSTRADIQSGTGWVHNTSMLEGIEKVVLRHPLTIVPKPTTFPGHRTAHTLLRRLTQLEGNHVWTGVPGVVAAAMRG